MKIKLHTKLGGPTFNNQDLRFESIKDENKNFLKIREKLFREQSEKLDQSTSLYLKDYSRNLELHKSFKSLIFNSRELIDLILLRLNSATKNHKNQTSQKFPIFIKQLFMRVYDDSEILSFIKNNITYIFNIRAIRNLIKKQPSSVQFRMNTDHLEAYLIIPLDNHELYLLPYLNIRGKKEAEKNKQYHATFILEKYYPEIVKFFETFLTLSKEG